MSEAMDAMRPKDEWYAYSPGEGFEWYNTPEDAEEAAEASLEHYRDQSGDGCSEEAANVHWGRLIKLGFSAECDREESPPGSCFDYTCDYRLHACADELARLRESDAKLRAENAALREQLAARETAPACDTRLAELAARWKREASPDPFYPAERTNDDLRRCAKELEDLLAKKRETAPATPFQVTEEEWRQLQWAGTERVDGEPSLSQLNAILARRQAEPAMSRAEAQRDADAEARGRAAERADVVEHLGEVLSNADAQGRKADLHKVLGEIQHGEHVGSAGKAGG